MPYLTYGVTAGSIDRWFLSLRIAAHKMIVLATGLYGLHGRVKNPLSKINLTFFKIRYLASIIECEIDR